MGPARQRSNPKAPGSLVSRGLSPLQGKETNVDHLHIDIPDTARVTPLPDVGPHRDHPLAGWIITGATITKYEESQR